MNYQGDEERIGSALQVLRSADGAVRAGPDTEARAVLAFRRQHRRRGVQRIGVIAAFAAGLLMVAALYQTDRMSKQRSAAVAASQTAGSQEVLTPFYPLVPSSSRLESGVIIRITVPASVMQRVGLPVIGRLSDPVQAEVLVGQDDLARAIRFVSYAP